MSTIDDRLEESIRTMHEAISTAAHDSEAVLSRIMPWYLSFISTRLLGIDDTPDFTRPRIEPPGLPLLPAVITQSVIYDFQERLLNGMPLEENLRTSVYELKHRVLTIRMFDESDYEQRCLAIKMLYEFGKISENDELSDAAVEEADRLLAINNAN